jgi:hypothetical protein
MLYSNIENKRNTTMTSNTTNLNLFQNFFEANQEFMTAHLALNKATNELMGKKFYSNDIKKVWQVINAYERGSFLSRTHDVLIEDIYTDLKFWSWQRWKYGWKHPRMMISVEVLAERFKKGTFVAIENDMEIEESLNKDIRIISAED